MVGLAVLVPLALVPCQYQLAVGGFPVKVTFVQLGELVVGVAGAEGLEFTVWAPETADVTLLHEFETTQ